LIKIQKQIKIKIQNRINNSMTNGTVVLVTGFDSELALSGRNVCPERSLIEK